VRNYRRWDFL